LHWSASAAEGEQRGLQERLAQATDQRTKLDAERAAQATELQTQRAALAQLREYLPSAPE